jgi:uncharacterized membrane protein
MGTLVATFDDLSHARMAVEELQSAGFARENISLMASDTEWRRSGRRDELDVVGEDVAEGAASGAVTGGILGGLTGALAGLVALAIPGLGPIIVAGPVAAALAGAGIGAATGAVLGALIDLGIPEDEAEYYAEAVRRGGAVVAVQVDESLPSAADRAREILRRHGQLDIAGRVTDWRAEGWTGYDYEGYDAYEPFFQRHYNTAYAASGYPYTRYEPAYRYAYMLSNDPRYASYTDWATLEPVAMRDWDVSTGNAWEEFKDTVRDAWNDLKGAAREVGDDVEDFFDPDDDFEAHDPGFREHYEANFAGSGFPYSAYRPGYRYGYALGTYDRYDHYDTWDDIEMDARREWEEHFDEPWERVKDAIRAGWNEMTGAVEEGWEELTEGDRPADRY